MMMRAVTTMCQPVKVVKVLKVQKIEPQKKPQKKRQELGKARAMTSESRLTRIVEVCSYFLDIPKDHNKIILRMLQRELLYFAI